jgi:murein DD-endopeptidase MepM/ murein hydrolase activator NlpD
LIAAAAAMLLPGGGIALAAGGGGVSAPAPPTAKDARCAERCLDIRKVAVTGTGEVLGKNLSEVRKVRLRSADGRIDVKPARTTASKVTFKVPRGSRSGKPVVVDRFGSRSTAPQRLVVKPASSVEDVGEFSVRNVNAAPAKAFFHARRSSSVEYLFESDQPTDIRIDVIRRKTGGVVDSIIQRDREPFSTQTATWGGLRSNGKVAPNGRYRYRVSPLSGGNGGASGFRHFDHKFILPAPHSYGDGLGAGRGHQGADVFARCGAKVVAARGGKVVHRAYHSRAGYYIVIAGRKTGVEYVYMHLQKRNRIKKGARVKTGQKIGHNGETGNASGCHVHFEMWSAPGWYKGGRVLDPMPHLKRWDRWS